MQMIGFEAKKANTCDFHLRLLPWESHCFQVFFSKTQLFTMAANKKVQKKWILLYFFSVHF